MMGFKDFKVNLLLVFVLFRMWRLANMHWLLDEFLSLFVMMTVAMMMIERRGYYLQQTGWLEVSCSSSSSSGREEGKFQLNSLQLQSWQAPPASSWQTQSTYLPVLWPPFPTSLLSCLAVLISDNDTYTSAFELCTWPDMPQGSNDAPSCHVPFISHKLWVVILPVLFHYSFWLLLWIVGQFDQSSCVAHCVKWGYSATLAISDVPNKRKLCHNSNAL